MLDRVATAANEISSLAVLDGDDVVFVARSSPARMFSGGLEIGLSPAPAFCTSVGRSACSASSTMPSLPRALKAMTREQLTPQTVTDLEGVAHAHRRRSYAKLFAGRPRGRATFPLDLGSGAPL
ncbi:IclR family transcriptional regulator domain-containing protein [Bradyrhizobium betae]